MFTVVTDLQEDLKAVMFYCIECLKEIVYVFVFMGNNQLPKFSVIMF